MIEAKYKCECPDHVCKLKTNDKHPENAHVPRGACVLGYIRQAKWIKVE